MHHIDDVVRQPKNAERQHNGQDEVLTSDAATEPGLSDPPQNPNVAEHDDRVGYQKAQDELQRVLDYHLWSGEKLLGLFYAVSPSRLKNFAIITVGILDCSSSS